MEKHQSIHDQDLGKKKPPTLQIIEKKTNTKMQTSNY
jgi:hypothetical protein